VNLHAAAGSECQGECTSSDDFDETVEHGFNARTYDELGNQKDDFLMEDFSRTGPSSETCL